MTFGAAERHRHISVASPRARLPIVDRFFVLTLPIGFVAYFEFWAIPISVFVFYVLVSLEIIAEEIEMPFGTDANDLPTQKLSDMIRRNVNEIFDA